MGHQTPIEPPDPKSLPIGQQNPIGTSTPHLGLQNPIEPPDPTSLPMGQQNPIGTPTQVGTFGDPNPTFRATKPHSDPDPKSLQRDMKTP